MLEIVKLDEHQGKLRLGVRGLRDRGLQRFMPPAPVDETRQGVVQGLFASLSTSASTRCLSALACIRKPCQVAQTAMLRRDDPGQRKFTRLSGSMNNA